MERKWIHLIAGLTMFALCISVCTTTANAAIIWSDDFNDGNYDGWTIFENDSNWTAVNYFLQLDQDENGAVTHPSDVAFGTWSFDYKVNETSFDGFTVGFISNNITQVGTGSWVCYWLRFALAYTPEGNSIALSLRYWNYSVGETVIDSAEDRIPLAGWHHIDVTRTTAGLFSVYHNDTHIMQGQHIEMDTSELFIFNANHREIFDNVVVSDTVDVDCTDPECPLCHPTTTTTTSTTTTTATTTTTTSTSEPPVDWVPIALGASAVVIVAVLVIILRRK